MPTDDAIWWHVYPIGFTGAEPQATGGDVVHRLAHLERWLDYAAELGCSGLQLGPIFASEAHGYDTVDHLRIDPRLGDDGDFDRLVTALGQRGLRLLLDGVFNHVGRSFPRFVDVTARGDASPSANWFRRQRGVDPPAFATFEGHESLVALNHREPMVADYVVEVMSHWLDRGADGWRLDAAYAMPRDFWRAVVDRVRADHPDAWFVGEVIHGDYAAIVAETGFDSLTQYELWKAIWSALNDGNFFELGYALDRHNGFLETFVPMTFVGNHDVTRIATRLDDERHLAHALVVLFTLGGVPSIYSGDEQAFHGLKEDRAGGDDAIRPAFPADPSGLPDRGWPTYRLHQDLAAVRHRHPWLTYATTEVTTLTSRVMAYTCRHDDHRLGVVLNIGDTPCEMPGAVAAVLAAEGVQTDAGAGDRVTVDAQGWLVFEPA
jgi:cyclomaltodextrinase